MMGIIKFREHLKKAQGLDIAQSSSSSIMQFNELLLCGNKLLFIRCPSFYYLSPLSLSTTTILFELYNKLVLLNLHKCLQMLLKKMCCSKNPVRNLLCYCCYLCIYYWDIIMKHSYLCTN
jgi:hypothetical protein